MGELRSRLTGGSENKNNPKIWDYSIILAPPVRLSFCRQKPSITASFGINNINVIYTLTSLYGRTTFSPNLGEYKKQAFRA